LSYNLIPVRRTIPVPFLLVAILSLLIFEFLFTFRAADDNRLTSWQWVFNGVSPATVFMVLTAGLGLALLFLRFTFSPRLPALVLFIASFMIASFFWKVPEVIVDASRYFTQAKHLELYGIRYFFTEWGNAVQCWTDLPLMPFLYGVIFRIFGESRLCVQIFTTILFSMTVVLTYLIGKCLWDEETGLLGGALLLAMPYLFSQVPLLLVDVPTMFFLALAIFTFLRAIQRGGWTIAPASAALFAAVFSKYSAWPMLSVLAVIGVVYVVQAPSDERNKYLLRSLFIIGAGLAAAASLVLLKHEVFSQQLSLLTTYQKPGLARWGESFTSTFLFQGHPFIAAAALFSFSAALRKRDIRYLIISWLVILIVVFQVKRIRYSLPAFPMVALMASYGLQQISDRELRRFIVLCALISSLTVSILAYRPFLETVSTVNLAHAGKFLDKLEGKTVRVYTLPQQDAVLNPAVAVPLLDLFTKKRIIYHYDPAIFPRAEETATSPLRFTWEYANPPYYTEENERPGENMPVVVLSNGPVEALPEEIRGRLNGYRLLREFAVDDGVYSFRTTVSVYGAQSHMQPQRTKTQQL
jgi:hypothetical protein